MHQLYDTLHFNGNQTDYFLVKFSLPWEGLMFHELTGYPHDSNAVQSALRLQLRQARLAKKKPTWILWLFRIHVHQDLFTVGLRVPPMKINKLKIFWNKHNCAPAKWALEKDSKREGECLTLPLSLFQKQWSYLVSTVVTLSLVQNAQKIKRDACAKCTFFVQIK